ncbi:hypothetical protein D4764_12G0001230 [Takifugu flavidus]|uniref:Uncharacterized protein n=1 Tax=Takifugu flavidus TaxID=433684 RepID=A0A5C6PB93_9TELE|nr:hypothetical protein D4764_12G0001230 [Takifugu flavidus]
MKGGRPRGPTGYLGHARVLVISKRRSTRLISFLGVVGWSGLGGWGESRREVERAEERRAREGSKIGGQLDDRRGEKKHLSPSSL